MVTWYWLFSSVRFISPSSPSPSFSFLLLPSLSSLAHLLAAGLTCRVSADDIILVLHLRLIVQVAIKVLTRCRPPRHNGQVPRAIKDLPPTSDLTSDKESVSVSFVRLIHITNITYSHMARDQSYQNNGFAILIFRVEMSTRTNADRRNDTSLSKPSLPLHGHLGSSEGGANKPSLMFGGGEPELKPRGGTDIGRKRHDRITPW